MLKPQKNLVLEAILASIFEVLAGLKHAWGRLGPDLTHLQAPQKPGVGGMKRFAWDSGETSNFRKTWSKTSCFCTFLKMRFSGAGERGVGGFPQ